MASLWRPVLAALLVLGPVSLNGAGLPIDEPRDRPWQVVSLVHEVGASRPFIFGIDFQKNGTAWLATSVGLLRYDGFDWHRFTTADGLPSDFVRAVLVTRDGELWVGTSRGAGVFDGRRFDPRGANQGLAGPSIRRIVEDPDGTLWFCSDRWPDTSVRGGLTSLKDGVWRRFGTADGLKHDHVLNYFRDSRGRQFALTIHSLSQRVGDRWMPPVEPGFPDDPQMTWQMVETPDHRLFVQQWDRMVVLDGHRWTVRPRPYGPLLITKEGELISARPDVPNRSITFDRWSPTGFVPSSAEVTAVRDVWPEMLRQAPDGAVWCVGTGILVRWQYGDRTWVAFKGLPPPQLVDGRGRVWFADNRSAWMRADDRFERVSNGRQPISLDGEGNVWAATADGLALFAGDTVRRFSWRQIGLVRETARTVDAEGHSWVIGDTADGRAAVSRSEGPTWRVVATFEGYTIVAVEPDPSHGLWLTMKKKGAGTYAIGRVEQDQARFLPLVNAPPVERPRIAIQGHHVWLYDYLGVFRAESSRLSEWKRLDLPFDGTTWHISTPKVTWFLFNGVFQNSAGVSAVRDDAWEHFPVDWRGVVVSGADNSLLLPGEGGFHIVRDRPGHDADFVALPSADPVNRVIQDREGGFWIEAARQVLRYQPRAMLTRAGVSSAVQEVRQDRELRLAFSGQRQFAVRPEADRFHYSWQLDEGRWSAFHGASVTTLEGRWLARGRHTVHVRARDAAGIVSLPTALSFTVLPIPLQERKWFWPALASLGGLLAYLTLVTWSAKRRLADQARALEGKVRERTAALELDIAKRQRTEAALRESEQRFRGVFNSTFQFIGVLGPDGTLQEANQTGLETIGATREQTLGRPFWETRWWNHSPALQAQLRRAIERAAHGELVRFETQYPRHDGRMLTVDFSLKPVLDDLGQPICLIAEGRDITERTLADEARARFERQMRQGQKLEAIGTLAGGIAHDFNNILTALIGHAELLADDLPDGDPARERLVHVLKAADRARDLVGQILIFSRRGEQERRVIHLHEVLAEALKLIRASLPSTIEIVTALNDQSPPVLADPTQMHQVIMNLCTNAAHAMRDGGRLTVRQATVDVDATAARLTPRLRVGRYVRVTVSDTGHGMDQPMLDRIFEPFFTTKPVGEGTGLGLSVVHGIMERHDGALTVESQLDQGTTFHLYLPAADVEPHRAEAVVPELPRGTGQRVLVVDDDGAVAQAAVLLLQRVGYRPSAYTNPLDALAVFQREPDTFDVVLTDLTMPRLTGVELARELRGIRADVRIILATGASDKVSGSQPDGAGFCQLVKKPYNLRTLADAVSRALQGEQPTTFTSS